MNSNNYLLRSLRILLLPVSVLYALGVKLRNLVYDRGWWRSTSFNLPLICVGNLAVGGTGKSPMVEFLLGMLAPGYRVATLSRGYKRKTKGYVLAGEQTTALEIGDEPMQFHLKYPEVRVAVGEERLVAIPQLLYDCPDTQVIILDDAFQHRSVRAGFNILLTEYSNLYTRDFYLPTGDLRDEPRSASRAQVIIVTKCPTDLTPQSKQDIRQELRPTEQQALFFTSIAYGTPYHIKGKQPLSLDEDTDVLLICGIANPEPLKDYLTQHCKSFEAMYYRDHHIFNIDDWKEIRQRFSKLDAEKKILLTTEKDAVRLWKFGEELESLPLYVLPIRPQFLFQEESRFREQVEMFIQASLPGNH